MIEITFRAASLGDLNQGILEYLESREPSVLVSEPADPGIRDRALVETTLSGRTVNAFANAGITTIGDLLDTGEIKVRKLPRIGRGAWFEVQDMLRDFSLEMSAYGKR